MNNLVRERILLRNCRIFDGESAHPEQGHSVLVEAGRIAAIVPPTAAAPAADREIELGGATLMPGLIDAHFHCVSPTLKLTELDQMPQTYVASFAGRLLESTLLRGFTTVRDAGGADIGLVRALDEGLIRGPRLFIAGKALSQTGGHGDQRTVGAPEACGCAYAGHLARVVDGVESMQRVVRDLLHHGAHHIKLFVSGGVLSPSDPLWMDQFTDEEIRAAVTEAARRRTYVMAHAHTAEAALRCVSNGVRTIEHGTLIDRRAADAVARAGAFVVPTISIIRHLRGMPLPAASLEKLAALGDQAAKAIEICRSAGVKLGLGTDYFGALHGREMQELIWRAEIETPLAVLRSATSTNGAIVDPEGLLGRIAAGAPADMIAVRGDPLRDISVLADASNLQLIMKGGAVIGDTIAA